jgi:hypothetical protein
VCAILFSAPAFAQEEVITEEVLIEEEIIVPEEEIEQSSIIFDGSPYNFIFSWKKKKAQESHWTGLGFAFSDLKGLKDADLNLSRSYSVVLNIGDYIVPIDHHWLFATGLGFDWSRYHFRGNSSLQIQDGSTQFVPDRENREYRDSKLLVYYATIPLLLEYQTKSGKKNDFFIYGGIEGLIKCYDKSQAEIRTPDGLKKAEYKDLNIPPLNFRFTIRAGFDDFSIFGYYQPYSMFEKGKGPDVNPIGLGVMLNF